ncbi:hypothetical protein B0T22DRAFT_125539 [Podospora appendiculata]|uniref:Uncharacterized protein n=1 Tax=Podospora appendiculata TaxID=314037 RepID=A0AAE0X7Y0_9PEZI|nr:hypothetical protein B0T22DRAFT_125539 [Podospora appendiculata]
MAGCQTSHRAGRPLLDELSSSLARCYHIFSSQVPTVALHTGKVGRFRRARKLFLLTPTVADDGSRGSWCVCDLRFPPPTIPCPRLSLDPARLRNSLARSLFRPQSTPPCQAHHSAASDAYTTLHVPGRQRYGSCKIRIVTPPIIPLQDAQEGKQRIGGGVGTERRKPRGSNTRQGLQDDRRHRHAPSPGILIPSGAVPVFHPSIAFESPSATCQTGGVSSP